MNEKQSFLYLCYDLKGIQSFIFQVPQLKYIIGGSAIIDLFDREFVRALKVEGAELLFAGGGRGAFRGPDGALERVRNALRERAQSDGLSICFGLHRDFAEAAHGADGTYHWVPEGTALEGGPCADSGLYPTNEGVHPIVRRRSGHRRHFEKRLGYEKAPDYFPKALRGHQVAFFRNVDPERTLLDAGLELQSVAGWDADDRQEFELARAARFALGMRNRWAVIAMDGNDLGAQFRLQANKLKNRSLSQSDFAAWVKKMSRELDEASQLACKAGFDAVLKRWAADVGEDLEQAACQLSEGDEGRDQAQGVVVVPLRPLVVGGDDIVVLCHAAYAMDFVCAASEAFTRKSKQQADLWPVTKRITISAGVLFSNCHVPLADAIVYAESLLASAKGRGRQLKGAQPGSPACVDWECITESVLDSVASRRRRELEFVDEDYDKPRRIRLSRRPLRIFGEPSAGGGATDLQRLLELKKRYESVPVNIRHRVLRVLQQPRDEREVWLRKLRGKQPNLVADLLEPGRWSHEGDVMATDVLDALLLMEEDGRMTWETVE